MENTQYVYCFSNKCFLEELLKIGWSRKHPCLRAAELYNTSIPSPFKIEFYIETTNGSILEKEIHNHLSKYRHNSCREFFNLSINELIQFLETELNLTLIKEIPDITVDKIKKVSKKQIDKLKEYLDDVINNYNKVYDYLKINNCINVGLETDNIESSYNFEFKIIKDKIEFYKNTLINLENNYDTILKNIGQKLMNKDHIATKKSILNINTKLSEINSFYQNKYNIQ